MARDEEEVIDLGPDPWSEEDPWQRYETGQASRTWTGPTQPNRRGGRPSRSYMTGDGTATEEAVHPPPRILNDVPPQWDGSDPENQLDPYVKLLKGWLATTRTATKQQGLTIMSYSTKDLRVIINELDIEQLTDEGSGDCVPKPVQNSYQEYMERKLPKALEEAVFKKSSQKQKNETFLQYVTRKNALPKQLEKHWDFEQLKGYILLRDAHLSVTLYDTVQTWTRNDYKHAEISMHLKGLIDQCQV